MRRTQVRIANRTVWRDRRRRDADAPGATSGSGRPGTAGCRPSPARPRRGRPSSRATRRPGSPPAAGPDRRRRPRGGSAGRGGCGPAGRGGRRRGPARIVVTVVAGEPGRQTGLLDRLAHGGVPRQLPGVDVTAGLDPDPQPLVAVQDDPPGPDDQGRGGDVHRVGVLVERVGQAGHLDGEALDADPLPLVDRACGRPRPPTPGASSSSSSVGRRGRTRGATVPGQVGGVMVRATRAGPVAS